MPEELPRLPAGQLLSGKQNTISARIPLEAENRRNYTVFRQKTGTQALIIIAAFS